MACAGLNSPGLPPAAGELLDRWLIRFGAALPATRRDRARIVDELRDGLLSATEHHHGNGADLLDAARLATAELGDPAVVAVGFTDELRAARARCTGAVLIGTGPLVGLTWIAALAGPVWPPRPAVVLAANPIYPIVLAIAIPAAVLAVAATGRLSRWLPSTSPSTAGAAAVLAAITCAAGDTTLLATLGRLALYTPAVLSWPTAAIAALASALRLVLATRAACVLHAAQPAFVPDPPP